MRRYTFALAALMALAGQAASAQTVTCSHDKFSGGKTTDITVSWVGTKFRLDPAKKSVQVGTEDGWWDAWKIESTKTTAKFTTYVAYRKMKDVRGKTHRMRYRFRVHQDGSGFVLISQKGFRPMKGTGTCT